MPAAFPSALLASGRPLTLRGSGHSCNGQTVTDGELLVTYAPRTAARQIRDLGDGLFEVPAGMSWYGVEKYLNRCGRSFPVLPNYLHMSVGGTLSVGGAGIDSVRHGMQVDHVQRIQLIDGTGTSRWCSRTEHRELFEFALGGLGMVGLIDRVVLCTVPYQPFSYVNRHECANLAELVRSTEQIAHDDDVDIYSGRVRGGVISATTGWRGLPATGDAENATVVADLSFGGRPTQSAVRFRNGDCLRLWADYIVPLEGFARMMEVVETVATRPPLQDREVMLYLLIVRRSADPSSFVFAPAGSVPVSVGVGVYVRTEPDLAVAGAVRREFGDLLTRCCELGGRPYLYGVTDLDNAQIRHLYGSGTDRLAQLRTTYGLQHVNGHLPLARTAYDH